MNGRQKAIAGGAVTLTVFIFLVCLVSLLACVGKPFPGFFYEMNRTVCPGQDIAWTGPKAGLRYGDLLLAVDGTPLRSVDILKAQVKAHPIGTPLQYRVQREGKNLEFRVPTQNFTWELFANHVLPWILTALFSIILGLVVLWKKPDDLVAWVHFAFCLSLAVLGATNIESVVTHRFSLLNQVSLMMVGMTGLHLSVLFPRSWRFFASPFRQAWCYFSAILIPFIPFCYSHPTFWEPCFALIISVSSLGMLAIVVSSLLAAVFPSTLPLVRRQALVILGGSFLTAVPTILSFVLSMVGWTNFAIPFADLSLVALPLAIAYAILRYRLFDIGSFIRRTLLYSLIFGILCFSYLLLLVGMRYLLGNHWELPTNILATAVIAILYAPLRDATKFHLERLFFRGAYDARRVMVDFSDRLLQTSDPEDVGNWFMEALDGALHPTWMGVYRGEEHLALWKSRGAELPPLLSLGEYPWQDVLLQPLVVREEILGMVILGPKRSELDYRKEDLELVKSLSQQMGLWLRSARLFLEVAEREHLQVQALREADRMKDEFLSVVSHELRTPFNAILGFGEALDNELLGPINERQHNAIAKMLASSDKILGLINDILDFTQIRAGMFRILPEDTDYPNLVAQVIDCLQPLWHEKHLDIQTNIEVDVPVFLDGQRIGQVLTNLVANAIKFTPNGGTIRIAATLGETGLVTSVTDSGIGIASEDVARLFTPFQQLDMSYTRREGGTGLGLSISRGLVEIHGGSIQVMSQGLGCGTTFSFVLPLANVPKHPTSPFSYRKT